MGRWQVRDTTTKMPSTSTAIAALRLVARPLCSRCRSQRTRCPGSEDEAQDGHPRQAATGDAGHPQSPWTVLGELMVEATDAMWASFFSGFAGYHGMLRFVGDS